MPLLASKNSLITSSKQLFAAYCLLLLSLLSLTTSATAAPVLSIDTQFEQAKLQHFLDILVDPNQQYSIESLTQAPIQYRFTPLQNTNQEQQTRLWLRFSVANNSDKHQHLWLNFSKLHFSKIVIYKKSITENTIQQLHLSSPSRQASQLIDIAAHEHALFYLRLDDSPSYIKGLTLMSSNAYAHYLAQASQWKNASLSGLVVLFLLALFAAIKHRSSIFTYLFLYISGVLLSEILLLNLQWLWLEIPTLYQIIAIAILFFFCHCFATLSTVFLLSLFCDIISSKLYTSTQPFQKLCPPLHLPTYYYWCNLLGNSFYSNTLPPGFYRPSRP